ncbi:hypothetical protein DYB30_008237 [Aphanomyces astaci]|nr:hypothetical protein DYB30_008237 [Aphanomyces astaci]RHY77393.1 hypothetical protein DYB38_003623 [Aphanomyces astaci]
MSKTHVAPGLADKEVMEEPEQSPPHVSITDGNAGKRKRHESAVVVCNMCPRADIKYRCPKCERITCSLACCVAHKKQVTILTLGIIDASDFFFLQEISRSTSAVHLDVAVKPPPPPKKAKRHQKGSYVAAGPTTLSVNPELPADYLKRFPPQVQSFVQQAKKRGVFVHLHAPGMSKHKTNTSTFNSKADCLYWRVEVHFALDHVTIVEPKWSERQSLCDVVAKRLAITLENVPVRTKLKSYVHADVQSEWLFVIKKQFTPASTPLYYELDPTKPLADNLRHLAIVEFPTVLVTLQSRRHEYTFAHRAIEVVDATPPQTTPTTITEVISSGL